MTPQTQNPTAVRRQGFVDGMVSQAGSNIEATALTLENQRHNPVVWLAARYNVAISTARVFAEINGFARCQG